MQTENTLLGCPTYYTWVDHTDDTVNISDMDDQHIAECGKNDAVNLANAAHIVRCVNTHDALKREVDACRDALALILPLAKGYAAANRVGSNQAYIEQVEKLLNEVKS